jgi:hypothetical protein
MLRDNAIKVFIQSKYSLLAIITLLILIMFGSIVVLSITKKTPPQTAVAPNFPLTGQNQAPTVSPTTQVAVASSSLISSTSVPTSFPTFAPTSVPVFVPTSVPTAVPTPDLTADWHVYTNFLYGYTIKYPPDWVVQDLGILEPQVPSFVVFNPNTTTKNARSVTISVSTRSYGNQLIIGGSSGNAIIVGSIIGTQQFLNDSEGNASVSIILPRASNLLVLKSKTIYNLIFNQMLLTVKLAS